MPVDRIAFRQRLQASRDAIFSLQNKNKEPLNEELFKVLKKRDFQISELESILNKGADPNARDEEMLYTPLIIVSRLGDYDAVKLLIEKGAKVNVQSIACGSPLKIALLINNEELINLLRSKGALE
ncbi:MAG: ankyrin repeat domain-containing protein [Candidatus Melainabacteria bacterium]|nr:ankyrin repeat domain-containing protein [Candidatus Melainabacteria bacterium]